MTAISPGLISSELAATDLARLRAFLIDLDGVVYRGETLIPGAKEFLDYLQRRRYKFAFLTNNSTATARQFQEKLARLGIEVEEAAVFTSGDAAAGYLRRKARPKAGVYVVGESGLRQVVVEAGFRLDDVDPDFVVAGLDRAFDYDKLAKACAFIRKGAQLVGSNADQTLPTEQGLLPGSGAILAAIVACSGARPEIVGKPGTRMLALAMERLGVKKAETAIVGDRLDTDVLAGKRSRITTILVLTGVTTSLELQRSRTRPDHVFPDLSALSDALQEGRGAAESALPLGDPLCDSGPFCG